MKKNEQKSRPMDITTRFEVTFTKDFGVFKKGDNTTATLPIVMKWLKANVIEKTSAIEAAVDKYNSKDLVEADKKSKTKDQEETI